VYGIVRNAQQAYYERRIAREGLLAALAPYGITAIPPRIPAQRQTSEPGPTRP
jgi:hypothetical protein